jgi:hypothetical protein
MKRRNPTKNRMPGVVGGSSSSAPSPPFILPEGQEPKRIAPRERGPGTKMDPWFEKAKKKLRGY